jgi:hypothetical protein
MVQSTNSRLLGPNAAHPRVHTSVRDNQRSQIKRLTLRQDKVPVGVHPHDLSQLLITETQKLRKDQDLLRQDLRLRLDPLLDLVLEVILIGRVCRIVVASVSLVDFHSSCSSYS